jgi:hypothetical protein
MKLANFLLAVFGLGVITAGNASYSGTGPAKTGQILAQSGLSGDATRLLFGTATVTGDGASSTFDVNFIDGTEVLPFTPSAVICTRTGGAATNTISVLAVESITTTKFTVRTSAAVNAATFIVGFIVIK